MGPPPAGPVPRPGRRVPARPPCGRCRWSSAHPDPYAGEAGRSRRMTGVPDLAGLALAAVGGAPGDRLGGEHVHRLPELGTDPGVGRVAQHAASLTVLDLVPDLAAELEVEPPVVDRPGPVDVHVDAVVGGRDDLVERVRA